MTYDAIRPSSVVSLRFPADALLLQAIPVTGIKIATRTAATPELKSFITFFIFMNNTLFIS
jgi:hypothetical protein